MRQISDPSAKALPLQAHQHPGTLITVCGVDGSGKTSMIRRIVQHLQGRGFSCFSTFTPTAAMRGNPLFRKQVDEIFNDTDSGEVDFLGLCLLIVADLLQHIRDTIIPRLEEGQAVLCDRYIYTSIAEVRSRSGDPSVEAIIRRIAARIIAPDLALVLDVSDRAARRRIMQREDERNKPLDVRLLARQAQTYRDIAKENDLLLVSSEGGEAETFGQIQAHL